MTMAEQQNTHALEQTEDRVVKPKKRRIQADEELIQESSYTEKDPGAGKTGGKTRVGRRNEHKAKKKG